jgi:hypothetical protein
MLLNADFSKPAVLAAENQEWIRSPANGVDRIMLDRIGEEVARATSIVRYAASSRFSRHEHAKGEEFLVLNGIFSDEHGDYPAGTYVRNPPGSGHSPFSKDGCRIIVKLRQFDPQDLTPVVIDTNDEQYWQSSESGQIAYAKLHRFGPEEVQMLRLSAGSEYLESAGTGGLELLVVNGSVEYDGEQLDIDSWLRLPAGADLRLSAIEPATLWVKTGHLPA